MRSSDWQPIETAPLNPYGQPRGPVVLIWCIAVPAGPVACYFEPYGGPDNKPQWIVEVDGSEIGLAEATHWMPIASPWPSTGTEQAQNANG